MKVQRGKFEYKEREFQRMFSEQIDHRQVSQTRVLFRDYGGWAEPQNENSRTELH
jgi:hypothetical protein